MPETQPNDLTPRDPRYYSHALVTLRRYRHLPFGTASALLLDLSLGGFKLEFTGDRLRKPGDQFWLDLSLAPFGIHKPSRLLCRGECRWFDPGRARLGGTFLELSRAERHVIEQITEALRRRGFKVG